MMIRIISVTIIFPLFIVRVQNQLPSPTPPPIVTSWSEDTMNIYPNPLTYPKGCNRLNTGTSYVCDPNKVLTQEEGNHIDEQIQDLRHMAGGPCNSTSSYTGLPMIVTIMRDFQSKRGDSVDDLMMAYAKQFTSWKFYDCDDAIVYVISSAKNRVCRYYAPTSSNFLVDCNILECSAIKDGNIVDVIDSDKNKYSERLEGDRTCGESKDLFTSLYFKTTIIIISVIGGILLIVAITVGLFLVLKNRRRRSGTTARGEDLDELNEGLGKTRHA